MGLAEKRTQLVELLKVVGAEPPIGHMVPEPSAAIWGEVTGDLWVKQQTEYRTNAIRLDANATRKFQAVLAALQAEAEDGELEHLSAREVWESLWHLVAEAWLAREFIDDAHIRSLVQSYIEANRREQEEWTVSWQIEFLALDEGISVGGVTFGPISEQALDEIERLSGPRAAELTELHLGDTFARTTVHAGTKPRAVLRAKPLIDDALDILRVAISSCYIVPEHQRLQRRGSHYFAYLCSDPGNGGAGGEFGVDALLGVDAHLLTSIVTRLESLGVVLNEGLPKKVREPVRRALIGFGESMTRVNLDSRFVDLCTALEAALCMQHDARKAQAIVVRYMLTLYATEDPIFTTHPLEIYDLYLVRSRIVHGSARRVATEEDCRKLRLVLEDAIDRLILIAINNRHLRSLSAIFEAMATVESLRNIIAFADKYSKSEAANEVGALAREWLAKLGEQSG